MRQNIKIFKIEKKRNYEKKFFFTKKIGILSNLSNNCLKIKVHKILGRETNVHVLTFM